MNLIDKIDPSLADMIHNLSKDIVWIFSDQTSILTFLLALCSIFLSRVVLIKAVSTIKFIVMKRAMLNGLLRAVENKI